jgi:hypothetical protein
VEAAILAATGLSRIVWRPLWKILEEEGLQPPPEVEQETGGAADGEEGEEAADAAAETVEVREAGLRLQASPTVS